MNRIELLLMYFGCSFCFVIFAQLAAPLFAASASYRGLRCELQRGLDCSDPWLRVVRGSDGSWQIVCDTLLGNVIAAKLRVDLRSTVHHYLGY
jgi:hypothetical protein